MISFNLSNKSRRTFIQKGTVQRPFDYLVLVHKFNLLIYKFIMLPQLIY